MKPAHRPTAPLDTRSWLRVGALLLLVAALGAAGGCDDAVQAGHETDLTAADTPSPDQQADTETPDAQGAADTVDTDAATDVATLLGPPYPIVLAHGMGGFEYLAGVEEAPYFFGVREALEAQGERVLTPAVDPLNTSDVRGAQLAEHIDAFLRQHGYGKVIIIGHSQGGLDARWVAHHHPDQVAAVVTYATPNLGSPIADVVLRLVPDARVQDVVDALVALFGQPLYDELGEESSLFAPLRLFAQPGITEFNARITDQPGVAYYSVTGRSDLHLGGLDCLEVDRPQFIIDLQFVLDPIDLMLAVPEMILDGGLTDPYPNDGLVRVRDARWGRFLGCVPADHMDEVGQLLGDAPGGDNRFDHVAFFVDLVGFLRAEGF